MLVAEVQRFIDAHELLHLGAKVMVSVSGGADSMALLSLLHQLQSTYRLTLSVAHVNHQLRIGEAIRDALFVERYADKLGLPFHKVDVDVKALKRRTGLSPQHAARQLRHDALQSLSRSLPATHVALGHTADDQAETVLLQLLRGGALDALAAMRADRRPLLGLRRTETERVCELVGYEPIRDPSNADPRFWRSRVRHEVIPLLCDVAGRDVVPLLARGSGLAAADADLLDVLAADIDPTSASELRNAPVALARRAIRAWLRTDHPPDAGTVERVLEVARHTHRATEVGGGRRVSRSADRLRLEG